MKTLIIVDVQNDFTPGGSLEVENGDAIIPAINGLTNSGKFDMIIATQDWHPEGHISFASTHSVEPFSTVGGETVWPTHCVAGSKGAELRPSLDQKPIQFIVRKGMNIDVDSYSAFVENDRRTGTGLFNLIPKESDIYIVGIATDVCVDYTARDARVYYMGEVNVIVDACAAVSNNNVARLEKEWAAERIHTLQVSDILDRG